jgi:hypothetical protein
MRAGARDGAGQEIGFEGLVVQVSSRRAGLQPFSSAAMRFLPNPKTTTHKLSSNGPPPSTACAPARGNAADAPCEQALPAPH